jgi:chromosome segregation ATPase
MTLIWLSRRTINGLRDEIAQLRSQLDDLMHQERLNGVQQQLTAIRTQLGALMAKEQDLEQLVTDLDAETNAVAAKIDAQTKAIQDLQAQIASGTPVSQEQLDKVVAGLTPISDRLKTLGADTTQPIPPAA